MPSVGSTGTSKSKRSLRLLIPVLSIVGLLVILGAVFLVVSDNGPVAAASAELEVVFNGTNCRYRGPAEIVEGGATFELTNESSIPISVVLFHFGDRVDFEAELDYLAVGADMDLSSGDLPVGGVLTPLNFLQSGSSLRSLVALDAGLYTVDCIRYPTAVPSALDDPDHAWRSGTIQVVP